MFRLSSCGPAAFSPADWADAVFAGPVYAPPYAGTLHDEFAWHLVKYLREDAVLHAEVPVEAPGARFELDFVVEVPREDGTLRRVAFEIGGGRDARDARRHFARDASVMDVGGADVLYRLRGSDLFHRVEDVLFLASQWDAGLFSERGRINLRTLASPEARTLQVRPEQVSVLVTYALDPLAESDAPERHLWHVANGQVPHVLVHRMDRAAPEVWAPYAMERPDVQPSIPLRKVG
ncbi:MAG: hypothetical protein ACK41D_01100 [Rubricoccaceae bacterium]